MDNNRQQVLDALRRFNHCYPARIAKWLNMPKRDVVEWLFELQNEGLAEYCASGAFHYIPPPPVAY